MTHYVQVSCEEQLVTQQELVRDSKALLEEVAVRAGGEQAAASMLTHLLEDVACVRPRRGTSQSRDGAARSASPSPAQPSPAAGAVDLSCL